MNTTDRIREADIDICLLDFGIETAKDEMERLRREVASMEEKLMCAIRHRRQLVDGAVAGDTDSAAKTKKPAATGAKE